MRWNLIDRIDLLVPGERASGVKTFDPELPLFLDHFPSFPVVPGVLITEALAQLAGKLIGYTVRQQRGDWPFPILSMADKLKFRRFCKPGEVIGLEVEIESLRDEMAAVRAKALVEGKVHAQGELVFVFNAVRLADPADAARLERIERAALESLWADCPPEVA